MYVEERQPVFDGENGAKAIGEWLRRNEDRDRRKRISRLDTCESMDESRFKSRMKATRDDLQHGESLYATRSPAPRARRCSQRRPSRRR